jgi:hypothetical protein
MNSIDLVRNIKEIITALQEIGFNVVATVSNIPQMFPQLENSKNKQTLGVYRMARKTRIMGMSSMDMK